MARSKTTPTPRCHGVPPIDDVTVFEVALPDSATLRLRGLAIQIGGDSGELLARAIRRGLPIVEQEINATDLPFCLR